MGSGQKGKRLQATGLVQELLHFLEVRMSAEGVHRLEAYALQSRAFVHEGVGKHLHQFLHAKEGLIWQADGDFSDVFFGAQCVHDHFDRVGDVQCIHGGIVVYVVVSYGEVKGRRHPVSLMNGCGQGMDLSAVQRSHVRA